QIAVYITDSNWTTFLKRHMDVTDVQKTFNDQPNNVDIFTDFIRSAFNFFIQESLSDKDVIDAVKNLNYMTVDMEIFTADRKDALPHLDIRSLLKEECSQNTISQASPVSINDGEDSESLQENFSDIESFQEDFFDIESLQEDFFNRSQHVNDDLECGFSMASDTSSCSDQLTIAEEIEESEQII
ncbi:6274_t:CDS:2, partial [Racocetra fulgida]